MYERCSSMNLHIKEKTENMLNSKYITKLHQSYKAFTINSQRIIFLGLWRIE